MALHLLEVFIEGGEVVDPRGVTTGWVDRRG
jgi:hypothetical protein